MTTENQTSGPWSTVKTKILNPEESLALSYLVSFTNSGKLSPQVSVRAKGIVGKSSEDSKQQDPFTKYLTLILGVITGVASLLTTFLFRGKSLLSHSGDKAEIVAYLCYLNGLPEEGDSALDRGKNSFLYSESDRLTALALASADPERLTRTISCLEGTLSYMAYRISAPSKAIVMMNLGKLLIRLDETAKATEWLRKAIAVNKEAVKQRMIVDAELREFAVSSVPEIKSLISQGT
jgi:hypothetical protein